MLTCRTHSTHVESSIDFVVRVTCKKFRTKQIHIVAAILDLTTQRGLETIYTSGKL